MDRINHVKIVSPDPEAIDRFLTEVLEVPKGWQLAAFGSQAPAPTSQPAPSPIRGAITWDSVGDYRGSDGSGGVITGSTESRQFQILRGPKAHIWSVAVATRHLERAHERCVSRGIPVSEMQLVAWGKEGIRAFFAEVGGIVFEVLRVEAAPPVGG
jgi:catechol 2,3-dioxygenase-like lactoylglutathione lyase family enzyme